VPCLFQLCPRHLARVPSFPLRLIVPLLSSARLSDSAKMVSVLMKGNAGLKASGERPFPG